MTKQTHYIQLDGLRAFAVISVMIGHWITWDTQNAFIKAFPWHHGVILFFVLSGYLISQILLAQKDKILEGKSTLMQGLKTFYARRFLRIFPVYYLLLFFLFYINFQATRRFFGWLVGYATNFLLAIRGDYIGDFNHLWSLAIEEQFYLVWPLLLFLIPKNKILRTIIIAILVSLLSRLVCAVLIRQGVLHWMWGAYFTLNLVLPLALGALLAYIKHNLSHYQTLYAKLQNPQWLYISAVTYGIMYYICDVRWHIPYFREWLDEYLFAIVCFFIILRAANNDFRYIGKYILEHDVVSFTGKISYGLYLYHLFVIGFFWKYLVPTFGLAVSNKPMAWFLYFVIAYIFAIASYYIIELPINNLKRYFNY